MGKNKEVVLPILSDYEVGAPLAKTVTMGLTSGSKAVNLHIEDDDPAHREGKMGRYHGTLSRYAAIALARNLLALFDEKEEVAMKKPTWRGAQEYKGNGKHDWQVVTKEDGDYEQMTRLRVPGGWLYSEIGDHGHMTFVPLPPASTYVI